jgi:phospholipid/cholesterol/gamma-HCH transport system permease protein
VWRRRRCSRSTSRSSRCQRGLATRGGAEGVGRATTSAVVTSLFAIVLVDAIFTVLFNAFGR